MAYTVMMDKPDYLAESLKNKSNLKVLNNAVALRSISHAYLFSGSNTDLLADLALKFAATVNCKDDGCGSCRICLNTLKGIYENILIIEAEGAEITIDKIRQLQRFMATSAHPGGRKICIIKEAELMNQTSANSLLKVLEEPPGIDSMFILLVESSSLVLPTISSRCIVFEWDFKDSGSPFAGAADTAKKYLFDLIDAGIKEILMPGSNYASAAGLSLRITDFFKQQLSLQDDNSSRQIEKLKGAGATSSELKKFEDALKSAARRREKKYYNLGMQFVFDIITAWLSDIVAVIARAGPEALNYPANFGFIKKNAVSIKVEKLIDITEVVEKNRSYLKFSIYEEIAIDNIFLKLRKALEQN
ncbi:MAG: hypothetical protein FJW68_02375 [Actinobacteria bacterium]|nr:hypothetical protein [Actinomycetota bacterium]